jgi:hypothetical protein
MDAQIKDFYIMFKTGLTIFEHVQNQNIDGQLFGGFISAINTLATQFDKQGLSSFVTGKRFFLMHKTTDLIFIAAFEPTVKSKDAQKALLDIVEQFTRMFPPSFFEHWQGNLSPFKKFGDEFLINPIDPTKRLMQALW